MSYLPLIYLYNAGSAPTNVWNTKTFVGTTTTDGSGVASFNVTVDGTSGGAAFFTTIYSITVGARVNTTSAVAVPSASVKQITSGKIIDVNVVTGRTLLALGATAAFVGAGVVVDIIVVGV